MARSALAFLALLILPAAALGVQLDQDIVEPTAFSPDDLYRAHWLSAPEADPPHLGRVASVVGGGDVRMRINSARPFDEVVVMVEGSRPAVGARLHTFRAGRDLPGVGRVVVPTGVLTVVEVRGGQVVARVDKLYDLLRIGDLVEELPAFTLRPGTEAQPVVGAMRTEILGFGERQEIQMIGDYVFLDAGSAAGLGAGDVFDVVWSGPIAEGETMEGRVQVVRVASEYATARVTSMTNPVFYAGVMVRLSGRMR